jgi:uncharacterized protein involved in exopolysaccharide biosynthesis
MHFTSEAHANSTCDSALHPSDLVEVVRTHVRWWAIPAIVGAVLAAAYSFVAPRHWQATQALIVRPEAAGVSDGQTGKFSDLSEMKTVQETILELARSQSVVRATLQEVGPPASYGRRAQWPTPLDVEELRECIDMRPPGGAEFGKTEVFYLAVRDTSRQRAKALVAALCSQLVLRMQEIRDLRAHGMVVETERTVAMAEKDLVSRIEVLSAFESKIGADLAELRNLNAEIGGQGEVSQELQSIQAERRANESSRRENERLLKLLVTAQDDPQQLLATPNSLLRSQPAVAQLKSAFVAAKVRTASLLGSRSENHPFVLASREAEQSVRDQLHDEVAVAIRGLKVDIELNADRERALAAKWTAARERLSRLAESRAEYANLVASVDNHTKLVEAARKNLADARARQAGARSASVISRIDGVQAGVRPVGPSRKTITAAGGAGGLLLGFGVVFLFANPSSASRRLDHGTVHANGHGVVHQQGHDNDDVEQQLNVASTNASVSSTHHSSNCAVPQSKCSANGNSPHGRNSAFGLFPGMTLEEAIRSVKQRDSCRPVW